MRKLLWILGLLCACLTAKAQKLPVYAEAGFGFGQTLFFGDTQAQLKDALGGGFNPNIGSNLAMGFYIAPEKWKGLGLGSRMRGTFGSSVKGDFGDSYIFNYYTVALTAKYYPFSKQFNKGFYARGSVGFGQFTTKRINENSKSFVHQYAIGNSLMLGTGYSLPFKKSALSIEAEFEYSNRNGTVTGKGDVRFGSGQLGINLIYSF